MQLTTQETLLKELVAGVPASSVLIVTQYPEFGKFLSLLLDGGFEVTNSVNYADIAGKVVIGSIPNYMASFAHVAITISCMVPRAQKFKDIMAENFFGLIASVRVIKSNELSAIPPLA